jgi:tetratricopeptide (TPR) repeat protein
MPQDIPFSWSEDENMLYFVLQVRGAKPKSVDIALCDVYIKVNCHPRFFDADLLHEVEPEHRQTVCKIGASKVTLSLRKRRPGLWHDFRAVGTKDELRARRQKALERAQERERERIQLKDDRKHELLKAAEHEQWRLDRENREQIEKWEEEEKAKWEAELLSGFDEGTGLLKDPAPIGQPADDAEDCDLLDVTENAPAPRPIQVKTVVNPEKEYSMPEDQPKVYEITDEEEAQAAQDQSKQKSVHSMPESKKEDGSSRRKTEAVEDTEAIWTAKDFNKDDEYEEYIPDIRENPGKVGLRFSVRPRPGVPVRDRGQRAPPHPKDMVKSELPPMLAGDMDRDESDPVWLKDKADACMVAGDYQGAYNAYTEALKLAIHPNAFANRAVADLYLGNLEQCIEDCNRAIAILDKRNRSPDGMPSGPSDPQDSLVRARVEIRLGTAFLWLGAFKKAEDHFKKALDVEGGLDFEERKKVQEDLVRLQSSRAALVLKETADSAVRRAGGSEEIVEKELAGALTAYGEAQSADPESAVIYSNRCFAHLRAGNLQECINDADQALEFLKLWPVARSAPKAPSRPTRLDPPYLDDPTFVHPDSAKQGEIDWLMKHSGGDASQLPPLPAEYEWVKDTAEKNDYSWIAIRKKMSKATMDAVRDSTRQLQESLYSRNPKIIRDHMAIALDANKHGEGPSHIAIRQAEEFAQKIEDHDREVEAARLIEEEEARQEMERYDFEASLDPVRSGVAKAGFVRSHPVVSTQRRLYAKVLLRRAQAHELSGDYEAGARDLRVVRRIEPTNREAKQRLTALEALLAPAPVVEH